MTDRPILFSAPMVCALLEGRKTQTRRVIEPTGKGLEPGDFLVSWPADAFIRQSANFRTPIKKGFRLWVREAWRMPTSFDGCSPSEAALSVVAPFKPNVFYEADGSARTSGPYAGKPGRLRASLHMPRWASRITLDVTDVRIERLQDISEADAIAEGIYRFPGEGGGYKFQPGEQEFDTAVEAYRDLWNHINGPGSWEANPWVVAYTSDVIPQNIDQIRREEKQ